jgi:hypothetical protein
MSGCRAFGLTEETEEEKGEERERCGSDHDDETSLSDTGARGVAAGSPFMTEALAPNRTSA